MKLRSGEGVEDQLIRLLNSGLTLEDNFQGGYIKVTTDATPGVELEIVHGLGFVPNGYIVLRQDKAGSLFEGASTWTTEKLYLASDAVSLTATLFVL